MALVKISELPDATTITGAEVYLFNQGGNTKKGVDKNHIDGLYAVTGLDTTGVSGTVANTAILTDAMTDAPTGTTLLLPEGNIKFSSLPDIGTKRLTLQGVGFTTLLTSAFGNASWQDTSFFHGTCLISTATTGNALAATGAFGTINLVNLGLIGPGSGTSIGVNIGSTTRVAWQNVVVANFATDVHWEAQISKASHLAVLGCQVGLELDNAANGNAFDSFEVTASSSRGISALNATQNVFNAPVLQGNTGDAFYCNGGHGFTFIAPYFENEAPGKNINIVAGDAHSFYLPHLADSATSTIAGNQCSIIAPQAIGAVVTITGSRFTAIGMMYGMLAGTGLTIGNGVILMDNDVGSTVLIGDNHFRVNSGRKFYFESVGTGSYIGRNAGTADTEIGVPAGVNLSLPVMTTTTVAPAAGGGGALPATPVGYMEVRINGTIRKIAYY